MEITVKERSRTSSQAASSLGLIAVAILILAGPLISIILALFVDLPTTDDYSTTSGCSATTTTPGQQCPAWYGYYNALVQGATFWFLHGLPRLAATLFALHLAICAAYVGLIHLGIISSDR